MTDQERSVKGLSVLVVEDEPDAAHSLAILLRLFGHRAQVAPDGPTALRMVAEEMPEVVLLDIGLPGMDGCYVACRLNAQYPFIRPLLVAVTGFGHAGDRRRSLEAGIDLHLTKPVEPDALAGLLRRFEQILSPG